MIESPNGPAQDSLEHGECMEGPSPFEVAQFLSPVDSSSSPDFLGVKFFPVLEMIGTETGRHSNLEAIDPSGLVVAPTEMSAPSGLALVPLDQLSDKVASSGLEMAVESGSLVLFSPNRDGEDDPTPIYSFHPNVSDWVIQRAMDIKHMVGISSRDFEAEFMALLTAVEAVNAQSKTDQSLASAKKREREFKRLDWAMKEDGGEKSYTREHSKGRGKMVVP